jgi:L-aminopeptidase/D-esterase-like protein
MYLYSWGNLHLRNNGEFLKRSFSNFTEDLLRRPGNYNALTDVTGIHVGHYTDMDAVSGVTVVICPEGAIGGVDVRGSAPGTRETDLLAPGNLVEEVQAVVLGGGSVYGLTAADGVVQWLAAKGHGFPLDENHVAPIVPAAVLYDLGRGSKFLPPITAKWGLNACGNANTGTISTGCAGAGTGALSGSIKGGIGAASLILDNGITVGALVAVNSFGSVINPKDGRPWEVRQEINGEFGKTGKQAKVLPTQPDGQPGRNTTIGIVATDGRLTKSQAQKIAQMSQDGLARAIRPAHTMFDGDTIFCMATGKKDLPKTGGFFADSRAQAINDIGNAAADCMARAIIRGVLDAHSMAGMTAFCDLEDL